MLGSCRANGGEGSDTVSNADSVWKSEVLFKQLAENLCDSGFRLLLGKGFFLLVMEKLRKAGFRHH